MLSILHPRGMYSEVPPDIRTRIQDNPTLLVSWWATGVSLAIIVTRVCGRYVRIERLFREDKIMMAAIVPLLARMAVVHVVLIYGTNNTRVDGLSAEDLRRRQIGSKLVLAARIFYAIFIWAAKLTVCEFLNRISGITWRRSVRIFLIFIYYFLASTLLAVVIATLAECQPFAHHWQVIPDPGAKCRSGIANVITMGACDIITDLLLVGFPTFIIMVSNFTTKRKIVLTALFALSLILVAITSYRVPAVIQHKGSQQYRSLLASLEILAATAVSNVVVISSFVRDKGVKKAKYKNTLASASVNESLDHAETRRATITHHQWGSDSDLARDMGIRLDPELISQEPVQPRPALATGGLDPTWSFSRQSTQYDDDESLTGNSLDIRVSPHEYLRPPKTTHGAPDAGPDDLTLFDVGGLLARHTAPSTSHQDRTPSFSLSPVDQNIRINTNTTPTPGPNYDDDTLVLNDVGGLLSSLTTNSPSTPHSHSNSLNPHPPRAGGLRRGSNQGRRRSSVHFSDPPDSDSPVPSSRTQSGVSATIFENANEIELQDVGGLLERKY